MKITPATLGSASPLRAASSAAAAEPLATPVDDVSLSPPETIAGLPDALRDPAAEMVANLIDLPEEPAPKLARPVLMVHGFMGDASDYTGMIRWLERDGVNRFGGAIPGGQPFEADPRGDFFVMSFSKRWNPIERNVEELRAAIDEICRKTGARSIDIVAHSKGGLDVRTYLMDPDEKAEHVMLLGTPNHGAAMADLGLFARERLSIPAFPPSNDPDASTCLAELAVDSVGRDGKANNPVLLQLNEAWETQRERADFLAVAGAGVPTVGGEAGVSLLGDGLVSEQSVALPGLEVKRLWFRAHPVLPFSKSVMREMVTFFQSPSTQLAAREREG